MDREQLVQLLLDLYSARKEAKEYFDFFVDPDVDKLYEKYRSEIEKEMVRGKYGRSTARISRIKKSIKEFESFGVEKQSVIDLMAYTVSLSLIVERRKYVSTTFLNGMAWMASKMLEVADKNCLFDTTHRQLTEILSGKVGAKSYINFLRRSLDWSVLK